MKYKRILLKLSGEALMGAQQHGIDPQRIKAYAEEIKNLHEMNRNRYCHRWRKHLQRHVWCE